MAIISDKKTPVERPVPNVVKAVAKPFLGVTVDTRYVPRSSLLMHIEGSSWSVDYYSQVLGRDSATSGQGLGTEAINQQYRLLRTMDIKVTNALTSDQEGDTKEMNVSGSATVYPFLVPNIGDMFLASINDGREGLFQVTGTERMSIMREACHRIDYVMIDYSTAERRADLTSKVVQTFKFEKDFMKHGQNPMLFESDYDHFTYLRDNYQFFLETWFKRFFSTEFSTLVVPDQPVSTYDPFLTRAVLNHFSTTDAPQVRYVRVLNADEDQGMNAYSVWDAIEKRDRQALEYCFQKAGLVSCRQFNAHSQFNGIRFSGLSHCVYPMDPMIDSQINTMDKLKAFVATEFVRKTNTIRKPSDLLADVVIQRPDPNEPILEINGIKPVMTDGYYIFSKAFYDNSRDTLEQSTLELLLQDYFDNKSISFERLRALCEMHHRWSLLDSFYYTPILLILIKSVIRSI